MYKARFAFIVLLTCFSVAAFTQPFSETDLVKIREINTNIANIVIQSPLGFKEQEGALRQNDNGTLIYDAREIAGMHAQQYFVTEVPAKNRNVYMSYYTNAHDIALVTAAVLAEPAFAGSNWTLRQMPAQLEGETNEDILLAGVKVGNLNLRSKEKTAVLSLGFYEDPGAAKTTPVKEEPKVTAKCESGNCQLGKGELIVFDKRGILTDRLSGEFGGGQFIKGIHYLYGTGLGPASFEKDEGLFTDFILTDGTVTLSGYGLTDSVFDTKKYTVAGNCISGDCMNGMGKFIMMKPSFGRARIMLYEGKFKDGAFLSGTAFMEGVDTLFDGSYTIKNFHYRNAHNQAFADAVFIPKGYTEEIKGSWYDHSGMQEVPFYLSDDYNYKEGRFGTEFKKKYVPAWISEVFWPVTVARGEIQRRAAEAQAQAALEYDMKIHPNDYKTTNNYSDDNHFCSCCNGTGSVGSGSTFMGREIPKRCSCCGGTGKKY